MIGLDPIAVQAAQESRAMEILGPIQFLRLIWRRISPQPKSK